MDIFSVFSLFYIIYIFRAGQILVQIVREWTSLKGDPLSKHKKSLAGQSAFFIAVPPSVLVHEFFHALAIWYFGGRVVDFGFTGYGGYVTPDRGFVAPEQWLISIAGTIGSLLFGVGLWLALRHNTSLAFRYFGLRSLHVQVIVSLIFYPLLALGGFGDWATIYDFGATPLLSGVTAVLHITALFLFYRADRRGWFEMAGFETVNEQARFARLTEQAAQNPQDREMALLVIDDLRRGGALHKATTQLKQYLQTHPDDGEATAMLAALQVGRNNHVSADSKANAEKALSLGIQNPRQAASAYRILGDYALERNQYQEAINHFSESITALSKPLEQEASLQEIKVYQAYLYHQRSLAYRRQSQYDLAYADMEQAVTLTQQTRNENQTAVYQQELHIIEQQAGRPLGSSPNPPSSEDVV